VSKSLNFIDFIVSSSFICILVATLSAFLNAIRIIVDLVYATQKSRFKFELFLDCNHNLADVNRIHDYIVGLYNIGFPAGWLGQEQSKRKL
jgi:hypothetical protein